MNLISSIMLLQVLYMYIQQRPFMSAVSAVVGI